MEREALETRDIAELGTVSSDTQGAGGHVMEDAGFWTKTGISDD